MDETYCIKSKDCQKTYCPRHLKGFNGIYISLAEFNCEEELKDNNVYTKDINGDL